MTEEIEGGKVEDEDEDEDEDEEQRTPQGQLEVPQIEGAEPLKQRLHKK